MRYLIIAALILSFFSYNRAAQANDCNVNVTSCLPSEDGEITLRVYSYDGSCFWDTIIEDDLSTLSYNENSTLGCNNSSSCYILIESYLNSAETGSDSATIDCSDNACVDATFSDGNSSASLTMYTSSSSEYCCSDDSCVECD